MPNFHLDDSEMDILIKSVREHAMMDQDLMGEIVRYYVDEWTRPDYDDWFGSQDSEEKDEQQS